MAHLSNIQTLFFSAALLFPASLCLAQSTPAGLTVAPGYSVSVFVPPNANFTAPDSIAVTRDRVYIGYGDNNDPAGADGKSNQIVEYTQTGQQVHVYTVKGHNDGLKVDPATGKLWAMQNEDANPNLVIIDPVTRQQKLYTFATPPSHGGGYDDIAFLNGRVYFSASNPANNPNNEPAIVEAKLNGSVIETRPLLEGTASARSVIDNSTVTLNLQDPDSMTTDTLGDIVLDSQADSELILIRRPGTEYQTAFQIPLSSSLGLPQADDTLFVPVGDGFILVADTPANTVYALRKRGSVPGTAYTAAVATTNSGVNTGLVGQLNLQNGQLTPVATGFQSPHGLGYVFDNPIDFDLSQRQCADRPDRDFEE